MENFILCRDRVVHKSEVRKDPYQATHLRSSLGNYPSCYVRGINPTLTDSTDDVDCKFCLIVMKEQES